jgi:hypothetical protein
VETVDRVLRDHGDLRERRGRRAAGLQRAARHSLGAYAEGLRSVYGGVLRDGGG